MTKKEFNTEIKKIDFKLLKKQIKSNNPAFLKIALNYQLNFHADYFITIGSDLTIRRNRHEIEKHINDINKKFLKCKNVFIKKSMNEFFVLIEYINVNRDSISNILYIDISLDYRFYSERAVSGFSENINKSLRAEKLKEIFGNELENK
jgi:hypothetical protein